MTPSRIAMSTGRSARRHPKGKTMNKVRKNAVKDEVIMTSEINRFKRMYDTGGIIWQGEIVGLTCAPVWFLRTFDMIQYQRSHE